jgi:hypothetical protein
VIGALKINTNSTKAAADASVAVNATFQLIDEALALLWRGAALRSMAWLD